MAIQTEYFETIGNENGLNSVKENPCKLLDFGFLKLEAGQEFEDNSAENEIMAVVLGGRCSITIGDATFENIGKRPDVFSGKPYAVYIPAATAFSISGPDSGEVEVALCKAKAKAGLPGA